MKARGALRWCAGSQAGLGGRGEAGPSRCGGRGRGRGRGRGVWPTARLPAPQKKRTRPAWPTPPPPRPGPAVHRARVWQDNAGLFLHPVLLQRLGAPLAPPLGPPQAVSMEVRGLVAGGGRALARAHRPQAQLRRSELRPLLAVPPPPPQAHARNPRAPACPAATTRPPRCAWPPSLQPRACPWAGCCATWRTRLPKPATPTWCAAQPGRHAGGGGGPGLRRRRGALPSPGSRPGRAAQCQPLSSVPLCVLLSCFAFFSVWGGEARGSSSS